jgi:hypothetical protein
MKLWSCSLVVAAAACGGDKATAPAACDTFHGGIVAPADSLPGTYDVKSICQSNKPDLVPPAATGTITLTRTEFTAALNIQGQAQTISGTYTTAGETITVNLGLGQLVGTFRLRNDTLSVSGTAGTQRLSLVGVRPTS